MDDHTATGESSNEMEVMKKLEDEHLHLQREVRMIQADRLHRIMGVHPLFRRQDQLLRTLKKEYLNLMKDLKVARSDAHKKKDKRMEDELERALIRMEQIQIECDGGMSIMDELDGLVSRSMKNMLHIRKRVNASQGKLNERISHSEHRLMSAENKLETAMRRFNIIQCENKAIREQIEHILKDRALFKQEWDRMLTALGKGKKFLSDLFESSTLAYDQRDEWVTKLKSIQEKGKMDQMQQVQEMRDLQKAFDHEMKIYQFLAKKGVVRVNAKVEEQQEQKRKEELQKLRNKYEDVTKILEDIYDYTQEPQYDKIIEEFLKQEQENFSIYCLLTNYCAENEVLSREVKKIKRDIDDRRDFIEMTEVTQDDKIDSLTHELKVQEQRNAALKKKLDQRVNMLNETMKQVQDIFNNLECSLEPFENLLGDKQPSLHQLNLALCLITDKIKDHIETVYYCEHALKRHLKTTTTTSRLKTYTVHADLPVVFKPTPISLLVPADPCPSCIETRWMARVMEVPETPFDEQQVMLAIAELSNDPAYVRSDRVHCLLDCRATASRKLLATRHKY